MAERQDGGMVLTQKILKEIIHYDPETGAFKWKKRPLVFFANKEAHRRWNAQHAGKKAGQISPQKRNGRSYGAYLSISIFHKRYRAHRIAWLYMMGEWPAHDIDHKNGIGLDNRWGNLRQATKSQNQWNYPKPKNNKSGYKGVSFCKKDKRFKAQIRANGKHYHLGSFVKAEDAHAAYCAAAEKYHGQFRRFE